MVSDRVIYCHFRDLLHFKNSGDPVTMLRSVNPREAALVDVASGREPWVQRLGSPRVREQSSRVGERDR